MRTSLVLGYPSTQFITPPLPACTGATAKVVMLMCRDLAMLRSCCSALFEGGIFTPADARAAAARRRPAPAQNPTLMEYPG